MDPEGGRSAHAWTTGEALAEGGGGVRVGKEGGRLEGEFGFPGGAVHLFEMVGELALSGREQRFSVRFAERGQWKRRTCS